MRKIKHLNFINDLGNTKTSNDHKVKKGLLYRTSHLSKLDDEGIDKLFSKYKIKKVIDLRTAEELEHAPENEKYPGDVEYHHIPLVDEETNPAITKENRLTILSRLMKQEGGVKSHVYELYRKMVNTEMAQKAYKEIFNILINNDGISPISYHCTQGKDRTGVLTVLILSALGVNLKKAKRMYLRFNRDDKVRRFGIFIGMTLFVSPKKAVALHPLLTAHRRFINAALDEINTKYGGVENYLRNQIGLTDEDITKLRTQYVD